VFNNFAPAWFGPETFLYTAYINKSGEYEIPFQICMGLAFMFTMLAMIIVSLFGPKDNPKGLELDPKMFKVEPSVMIMIVLTILIVGALYVKFW
jgi:SSS family solute:Na+ symporter